MCLWADCTPTDTARWPKPTAVATAGHGAPQITQGVVAVMGECGMTREMLAGSERYALMVQWAENLHAIRAALGAGFQFLTSRAFECLFMETEFTTDTVREMG